MRIATLLADYRAGKSDPSAIAAQVLERIAACEQPIWISRVPDDELLAAARVLDVADRALPLYGVPFAVKDNIDVAGMPTTAACPGAASTAAANAATVQLLLDAGALLVGKTNLDQFATGLVGTRSPYGACASVLDPRRVSGGSSSGSAIAVALGQVAFALGTDTAGSGRVPAAFNGIVGVKPTRGLLSTRGVLPACASLDVVSVFAADVAGGALVLDLLAQHDPQDPWSRHEPPFDAPRRDVVGVPLDGQVLAGDPRWAACVARAAEHWDIVEVDVTPLLDAAPLLYGAWVAERTAAVGEIVARKPEGLDPSVGHIIGTVGAAVSGADVFAAQHRLAELQRRARPVWAAIDALLLPTAPFHPTSEEVAADPLGVNSKLGRFTNFVNLMDLSALAVPGPTGVTLLAPAFCDRRLLELGAQWMSESLTVPFPGLTRLLVLGAHMSGMALNDELTSRGARNLATVQTAPDYRLYDLGDGRPGLVRVAEDGARVEGELWEISTAALGDLLTTIARPLGLGRVQLADGSEVTGFLCEAAAVADLADITALGGWRAYTAAS
jgi:allophanate hydrolase